MLLFTCIDPFNIKNSKIMDVSQEAILWYVDKCIGNGGDMSDNLIYMGY